MHFVVLKTCSTSGGWSSQNLKAKQRVLILSGLNGLLRKMHLCTNLYFLEQPIGVAIENFCDRLSEIPTWLAKPIDDLAQISLVNTNHFGQSILAYAGGVNPQLEIRVNVSIQWHGLVPVTFQKRLIAQKWQGGMTGKLQSECQIGGC